MHTYMIFVYVTQKIAPCPSQRNQWSRINITSIVRFGTLIMSQKENKTLNSEKRGYLNCNHASFEIV